MFSLVDRVVALLEFVIYNATKSFRKTARENARRELHTKQVEAVEAAKNDKDTEKLEDLFTNNHGGGD